MVPLQSPADPDFRGPSFDLEGLVRPLLGALATIVGLDSTYLTVFDWDRREQEVRFVHSAGRPEIIEGSRLRLPDGIARQSLPGVTRSPATLPRTHPDSQAARRLGLRTYVSVPIVLAKHELYGMVCGASRRPHPIDEEVVAVMESIARMVAEHTSRARVAATEERAEAAEAQLRARAQFLAVAEHELKTPLASLLGASQILRNGWDRLEGGERDQVLDMVIRGGADLSTRIGGMLVEARADVQSQELAPVDLDLGHFVRIVARVFDALATGHRIEAEVEEGLTAWVDPTALHQMLGALLDNAIKYSPAPSIIRVVAHETPAGVDLAVVNQGSGLPAGVDIFAAFQRGDDEDVGVAPGIGLGLHIVRNVVGAMGGTVAAEVDAEGSTTFTISLPARPSGTGAPSPVHLGGASDELRGGGFLAGVDDDGVRPAAEYGPG